VELDDPQLRVRQITTVHEAIPEEYPAWSPDGNRLAFNSHRSGSPEIWGVSRDGTGLAQLTDGPSLDDSPASSPAGSRIAFLSSRTGEGDLYLMDPDGTSLVRLTDGPYF
jgi:TolB protein